LLLTSGGDASGRVRVALEGVASMCLYQSRLNSLVLASSQQLRLQLQLQLKFVTCVQATGASYS